MKDIFALVKKQWQHDAIGFLIAIAIVGLWIASFGILLQWQPKLASWGWVMPAIGLRTFLHTGLFAIAHDAMHRSLVPNHRGVNDFLGRLVLGMYAFLPYQKCRINHALHHALPGQIGDPDFHDGIGDRPWQWYVKFIGEYYTVPAVLLFLVVWCSGAAIAMLVFQISPLNLLLFGIVPLVLSSIQLFLFGTYFPHRQPCSPTIRYSKQPELPNKVLSYLWSLLSCYHFGYYHWEHHQFPRISWYQLPLTDRYSAAIKKQVCRMELAARR